MCKIESILAQPVRALGWEVFGKGTKGKSEVTSVKEKKEGDITVTEVQKGGIKESTSDTDGAG